LYTHFRPEVVSGLAKIHLYRILQELLGNTLKHADAKQVSVQLLEDQGNLLITVEDDGKGFDPNVQGHSDGIGLANVRTRVEVLRGTLHLESKPGRGTFVNIEVSIEATRSIDHAV
jgi:signal transduction histidine kinase